MTNKDKCLKIREIIFLENGIRDGQLIENKIKWRNIDDLSDYLVQFGGAVKNDKKLRKGYFVIHLYDSVHPESKPFPVCAEIPKEFGEKVMTLGGFP